MTCTCDPKPFLNDTFLKFSGGIPPTSVAAKSFLTDSPAVVTDAVAYPVPTPFQARKLKVNVTGAGLGPAITLRVRLLRDGIPVPGFELNYGGLNPISGIQVTGAPPELFSLIQVFDLEVTTVGLTLSTVFVSALLEIAQK